MAILSSSKENMLSGTNYQNLIDTLSSNLAEEEQKAPRVEEIRAAIIEAKNAKKEMQFFLKNVKAYNAAVDRIQEIQNLYNSRTYTKEGKERIKLAYPFNTNDAEKALIQEKMEKQNDTKNLQYIKSRLQNDMDLINQKHKRLTEVSNRGYSAIMHLRELLTTQTIIYAVQGVQSGNKRYQEFITEDQFLNLLMSKPQYNTYSQIRKFDVQKQNFDSFSLQVDFNKIINEADYLDKEKKIQVHSRDPLYKAISSYVHGENGKKLKESAAWEAYTEARRYFRNKTEIDEKDFEIFMGEWLAFKHATFQRLNQTKNEKTSFSSLAFYQGGDTSTYSKYIGIQNKSSSGTFAEAGVRIQTIYQALLYIEQTFPENQKINPENVKKLFTAYNLQNIPSGLATDAFIIANNYAQEMIEKNVAALNIKI